MWAIWASKGTVHYIRASRRAESLQKLSARSPKCQSIASRRRPLTCQTPRRSRMSINSLTGLACRKLRAAVACQSDFTCMRRSWACGSLTQSRSLRWEWMMTGSFRWPTPTRSGPRRTTRSHLLCRTWSSACTIAHQLSIARMSQFASSRCNGRQLVIKKSSGRTLVYSFSDGMTHTLSATMTTKAGVWARMPWVLFPATI